MEVMLCLGGGDITLLLPSVTSQRVAEEVENGVFSFPWSRLTGRRHVMLRKNI